MTVAENIVLGNEPRRRGGLLDVQRGRARACASCRTATGWRSTPTRVIEDMTVGMQQRVEILRALYRGAQHPRARRADRGAHRAGERRAVPRAARAARGRRRRSSSSATSSARCSRSPTASRCCGAASGSTPCRTRARPRRASRGMMVGRDVLLRVDKAAAKPGEPVLRGRGPARARRPRARGGARAVARGARRRDRRRSPGVDGNGQQELVDAIAGLRAPESGSVAVGGRDVAGRGVRAATRRRASRTSPRTATGAGWCSTSRWPRTSRCASTARRELSRRGWLQVRRIADARARAAQGVRRARRQARARSRSSLSGGNQQKVCIAREIAANPKLLIAHQPTRGLDVGAIEFVHRRLIAERDAGPRRSCWCRWSPRRCARWPTASSSSTRGGSSASCRPTRPRRSSAS